MHPLSGNFISLLAAEQLRRSLHRSTKASTLSGGKLARKRLCGILHTVTTKCARQRRPQEQFGTALSASYGLTFKLARCATGLAASGTMATRPAYGRECLRIIETSYSTWVGPRRPGH